ncbi:RelA/SpoT family protein [Catelliglobosispora koreensis]|uniref:RelA/SpoT family protein n=1 Tax=Catelliglobosispora koreensis TaxID=129052 RepID=UPI000372EA5E|nr:HD domain-containing protein [Catelliglobosispora koreensis]
MDVDAGASPGTPLGRIGESLLAARLRAMLSWPASRDRSVPQVDPVQRLIRTHRGVHPDADVNLLRRSYSVAERAHRDQKRKSGEPYITHPLEVAHILAVLGMDTVTLAAALLHDTVEDTDYTLPQLRADFGAEVALLVNGVTKFDKAHFAQAEAETIRKMIVSAGKDIRVLVIKIADRLHNMETLDARSPASRARIASATREVLVPLCDRLGIQALKGPFEDVVLRYVDPEAYQLIDEMVTRERPHWNEYVERFVGAGNDALKREKLDGHLIPRPRHYYTIWKDTKAAGSPSPINLPRVVVILDGDEADCYAALGVMHQRWLPIPGRFKDYIAAPKNNLYRSLHTTVLGPDDQMVEVLIRTDQMHKAVEYGVVAPYRYPVRPPRFGKKVPAAAPKQDQMAWLRRALELEAAAPDAVQFVQTLRCDLAEQQIQVFGHGTRMLLPAGATPVDVAYELSFRIGDRCVAATVNGVLTPLNAELTDGDVVDILVSRDKNHPGPRPEWLDFVKSPNARLRLSRRFSEPEAPAGTVSDRLQIGRAAIGLALRRRDRALSSEQRLVDLAQELGYPDLDTLLIAIAEHRVRADVIVDQLIASVDASAGQRGIPVQPQQSPTESSSLTG